MELLDFTGKTLEEVRAIADKLNIKYHHKAGLDTIVRQIMAQPKALVNEAVTSPPVEVFKAFVNTEEDVRSVIGDLFNLVRNVQGVEHHFTARFPADDTWVFSFMGETDSGHMSMPLRLIEEKARSVAKGRRQLRGSHGGNQYQGYTDTILVV